MVTFDETASRDANAAVPETGFTAEIALDAEAASGERGVLPTHGGGCELIAAVTISASTALAKRTHGRREEGAGGRIASHSQESQKRMRVVLSFLTKTENTLPRAVRGCMVVRYPTTSRA